MSLALARTHAPRPAGICPCTQSLGDADTDLHERQGQRSRRGGAARWRGLKQVRCRNRLWRMRQYEARLARFEHPCLFFQRVDALVQRSLVTSNHWQPRHAPCAVEGTAVSTMPGCRCGQPS